MEGSENGHEESRPGESGRLIRFSRFFLVPVFSSDILFQEPARSPPNYLLVGRKDPLFYLWLRLFVRPGGSIIGMELLFE
ncbi:MAG: hypothetical protein JRJ03_03570 [Deltaproteobacteria bacterium]|nr:hypothetical protein [Deltaproteobacteria bacterium]